MFTRLTFDVRHSCCKCKIYIVWYLKLDFTDDPSGAPKAVIFPNGTAFMKHAHVQVFKSLDKGHIGIKFLHKYG